MDDPTHANKDQPAPQPEPSTSGERLGSALEHGNNPFNSILKSSLRAICWLTGDNLGQAEDICEGIRNPPSAPVPPRPHDPRSRR